MKKIEIMFNPQTGNFVVHYSGVPTHAEEHALTDRLVNELRKLGFDVETDHKHDAPKIPEVEKENGNVARTRIRGG